jgi:hypothetical protein
MKPLRIRERAAKKAARKQFNSLLIFGLFSGNKQKEVTLKMRLIAHFLVIALFAF